MKGKKVITVTSAFQKILNEFNEVMIIHVIVGLIKNVLLYKNELFSTLWAWENKTEVKLDLSNYATKSDAKNATGVVRQNMLKNMICY